MKKAIEQLDTIYLSKDEQEMYEAEKKKQLDEQDVLRTAKEKGELTANLKNARKMKDEGLDFALISKITGLSVEEIEKL